MVIKKGTKIEMFSSQFVLNEDIDTDNPNEYFTFGFAAGSIQQVQVKAIVDEIKIIEESK